MRIVKVGVLAPTNKGIPLGVQGENRATDVEFDTRPWFREYPSGTVSAVARRNGDPAPYPLTLDVADGTAVWQVSDTDTAKAGEGAVELTMTSAGTRVRSLTFKTLVTASLTDAPVDDDAWYGWLDRAVVKVDETVQSAQRKMAEVDAEWTGLKTAVTDKVEELGEVAAQAASDAHHAKVDAQATAKALESAEGSVAKAEAAATRAEGAAEQAEGFAAQASASAGNSSAAASEAREASAQASGWADRAENSATRAYTSETNAALSATSAADSAERATAQKVAAENAKDAAVSFKAGAEAAKGEAAASASNAAASATAAAKSASDAAASVDAINVIAPKTVATTAIAEGYKALAMGDESSASGQGGVGCGYKASASGFESIAIGDSATSGGNNAVAIGLTATANDYGSIALGARSVTSKIDELSIGAPATETSAEYKREITHVSTPTAPTSASTKKYTDDNDSKTLTEAKKYTDANTSNALVNTVSGKLLHVEDAWPGKPLGLTIDGAYKQDGTPSPESPAPIVVVENPVLKVTGADTSSVVASLPITLPSEHPYLAALPDGTADTIEVDKEGNVSLVARAGKSIIPETNINVSDELHNGNDGTSNRVVIFGNLYSMTYGKSLSGSCSMFVNGGNTQNRDTIRIGYNDKHVYLYTVNADIIGDGSADAVNSWLRANQPVITYPLETPVTYSLGKLDIPSLPETISNVWIEDNLTPECAMTYKQDVNVVIAGLTAQIAALKGTNDIVHDDSTASPDDATVVLDTGVKFI